MTPNTLTKDATEELTTDESTSHSGDPASPPEATDAGDRISEAVGVLRATADQVGDRIPVVVETVRDSALESARTIQAMPEPSQRLLAAFSLGLGLGLSITGAPRLIVAATLVPAMFVAAMIVSRDDAKVDRA